MAKKTEKIQVFNKRAFLNNNTCHEDPSISVFVKESKKKKQDWYSIKIRDCNYNVVLHGSLENESSRKNALHKIDTLVSILKEMEEHMIKEFERLNLKYK